jgi:hypothetical protein
MPCARLPVFSAVAARPSSSVELTDLFREPTLDRKA